MISVLSFMSVIVDLWTLTHTREDPAAAVPLDTVVTFSETQILEKEGRFHVSG